MAHGAPDEPVGKVEEKRPKAPVGSRRIFPPQFKLQVSLFVEQNKSDFRSEYKFININNNIPFRTIAAAAAASSVWVPCQNELKIRRARPNNNSTIPTVSPTNRLENNTPRFYSVSVFLLANPCPLLVTGVGFLPTRLRLPRKSTRHRPQVRHSPSANTEMAANRNQSTVGRATGVQRSQTAEDRFCRHCRRYCRCRRFSGGRN